MRFKHGPDSDQLIRDCYRNLKVGRPSGGTAPLDAIAKRLGISRKAVCERARALGITNPKGFSIRQWSDDEKQILKRHAHLTAKDIKHRLQKAGYHRSVGAIVKYRVEHHGPVDDVRADRDYFKSTELESVLGVNQGTIVRWIRLGVLPAKTTLTEQGERYLILEKDLREFIIKNPTRLDLGKVDRIWFIPFLAGRHSALANVWEGSPCEPLGSP
jgi:biotin operon repressor